MDGKPTYIPDATRAMGMQEVYRAGSALLQVRKPCPNANPPAAITSVMQALSGGNSDRPGELLSAGWRLKFILSDIREKGANQ